MAKHPTPPPYDSAFLARRDPHAIREWLISYFTTVVDWTMADHTGAGPEGAALLRAFETVWSFDDVGRGISYLLMGRDLASACIREFDPGCRCLVCTFDELLGSPPIKQTAPHGESQGADPREGLSALPAPLPPGLRPP